MPAKRYGTIIVGGGPAALAPLVAASREGRLSDLLATGIAIVEKSPAIGAGRLGDYAIYSDSTAFTFLTAVTDHLDPRLNELQDHPLCKTIEKAGHGPIPLTEAAALMSLIGQVLRKAILDAGGAVLVEHEALFAQQRADGDWNVRVRRRSDGTELSLRSNHILLATGGVQPVTRLGEEDVDGIKLLPDYADKLIQSDEMLKPEGLALIGERLARKSRPTMAIVGGSTSALAATDLLLKCFPDLLRNDASITICHRRPLRIFYRSAEEAMADDYIDFGEDDICPISCFVYRLAGFRLDSRELVKRILGVGRAAPERRVALYRLGREPTTTTRAIFDNVDIIVAAFGYRPSALPIFDCEGAEIGLQSRTVGRPMVDAECRVIDQCGNPIPRVFGIGLAAGFRPTGSLGGEKSFIGQANGLWLWQTAVGSIIVDHMLQVDMVELEIPTLAKPFARDEAPAFESAAA